jgi:hypothetical protein
MNEKSNIQMVLEIFPQKKFIAYLMLESSQTLCMHWRLWNHTI